MSNAQYAATITDYASAVGALAGRDSRRIGYETHVERRADAVAVVHHRTDIVTYYRDGAVVIGADGWVSTTTGARLHRFTPADIAVLTRPSRRHYLVNGAEWDGTTRMLVKASKTVAELTEVEHASMSRMGNPTMRLHLADGRQLLTVANGSIGYAVENYAPRYGQRPVPVHLTLTRAGRVSNVQRA